MDLEAANQALERNVQEAFWHLAAAYPGVELCARDGIRWFGTDVAIPLANVVIESSSASPETVREVVGWYRERGLPAMWMVWPETDPPEIAAWIESGEGQKLSDSPGMVADLQGISMEIPFVAGGELREVRSPAELEEWAEVIRTVFHLPESASGFLAGGVRLRRQTVYWNGLPAATAAFFGLEDVAGIYCVATVPEARRQGLGAAVTLWAMQLARHEGYKWAVLQSSPDGYGVYERLGFVECGRCARYRI